MCFKPDNVDMESRWYLRAGQSPETTRFEDRGHALHLSQKAWGKLNKHLDRRRLVQEALDAEQARRDALKKGSEDMTKNWDNSVENVRKRKEEERESRLQKSEDEKMRRYLESRKEQEELRQKYIAAARRSMYISTGYPRDLTGALLFADTLYQRERQMELEETIRKHERDVERQYAEKVKKGAEDEAREKKEQAEKTRKKNIEFSKHYYQQIKEHEEQQKREKMEKMARERYDNAQAAKELAQIKKIEEEEEREKIARVREDFADFNAKQKRAKEIAIIEQQECELVIDYYKKAKLKIDCKRKKREKELQDAMVLRRQKITEKLAAGMSAAANEEQRILDKAQKEREQEELERLQKDAEYQRKLIEARAADREAFLKREKQRLYEENEERKWQMLNRFKKNEVIKQYDWDKANKQWQAILKYRRELFEQMAENDKQRQEDANIARLEHQMLVDKSQDRQFLEFAQECVDLAKAKGYRTDVVERVIIAYKKQNNIPVPFVKPCQDLRKNEFADNV